jgi:post-segregation antitoxin (ccd killing protein)
MIAWDLYSHVLPNMQADAAAIVDGALSAALKKSGSEWWQKDSKSPILFSDEYVEAIAVSKAWRSSSVG